MRWVVIMCNLARFSTVSFFMYTEWLLMLSRRGVELLYMENPLFGMLINLEFEQ